MTGRRETSFRGDTIDPQGSRRYRDDRDKRDDQGQARRSRSPESHYEPDTFQRVVMDQEKSQRDVAFDQLDDFNNTASEALDEMRTKLDSLKHKSDEIAHNKLDYKNNVQTIKDVLNGGPVPSTLEETLIKTLAYKNILREWRNIQGDFKRLQTKANRSNEKHFELYQSIKHNFMLVGRHMTYEFKHRGQRHKKTLIVITI